MEESTKRRLTERRAHLQEQIATVTNEIHRCINGSWVLRELNQKRHALGKACAAIGRLLAKAGKRGAILNEKSFATQLDYIGGGARKVRAPKEEKKSGKMKASQRKQLKIARGF